MTRKTAEHHSNVHGTQWARRASEQAIAALAAIALLAAACTAVHRKTFESRPEAPAAAAGTPTPGTKRVRAITDVSVVDVENGRAIPGQTVLVEGERIARIDAREKVGVPSDAEVTSGRGLFLMPGLADAHVHFLDAPVFSPVMLASGVLLVRDMGMPNEYIFPLRDGLNRGEMLGPEMIAAGVMLDGTPPLIPSIALGLRTPEEGRAAVRQQATAGANMIKVYARLDREVFLAILDEARRHGLKVVGHVPDTITLEEAAEAGLASSEHFFGFERVIARLLGEPKQLVFKGMGSDAGYLPRLGEVDPQPLDAFYRRLRASGLTVVPTVVTFKNFGDPATVMAGSAPGHEYLSPSLLALWKAQWAGQSELPEPIWRGWAQMVRDLNRAGVPLMVGTDLITPGVVPGFSVHQEMEIWQAAGVPPADVLRSATLVPARFMGLGDRLGSVTEGKKASMLLVRGNPLEDVQNAALIEGVFLRGRYLDRQELERLLAEARTLASEPAQ